MNLDKKDFSDSRGSPTSISNISRSSEEFVSHAVDHVPLSNQSKDSPKDSTRRFFVSPSGGYRASGIPASRKLSSILTESTFSDKSEGATRMMIRFPANRRLNCRICIFQGTSNQLTLAAGQFSWRSLHLPGATEDSSIGTSDSREADSETRSGVDDKRVFCNGSTTLPEGNKGTMEGAMVSSRTRGSPRSTSPKHRSSLVGKFADNSSCCQGDKAFINRKIANVASENRNQIHP